MTTKNERVDFVEKLAMLRVVFPNIPEVEYYGRDNEDKNKLKVMTNNQIADLKPFNEVLVIGNTVMNVAGNNVTKNLETVICVTLSLNCQGFIGYLI